MMISIAMTTFNGEKYLREQIDSILAQTIQDFELIVCDDCSTDGTWAILEDYAKRDSRMKIFQNEKNIGFKENFEKAMSLCKGDYIALSDQDDIWMPDHLEVLIDVIGDSVMACGNCDMVGADGQSLHMTLKQMEALRTVSDNPKKRFLSIVFLRNAFQGASMLLSKSFLDKVLPIPEGVGFHDTWISALACVNGGFNYTDRIVNKYRKHGGNITAANNYKKFWLKELARSVVYFRLPDREALMDAIIDRNSDIPNEQKSYLYKIKKIVQRERTKKGRLYNLPFRICHLKSIYL